MFVYNGVVMSNRQQAIEKIEAWARWETGRTPDKNPGLGIQQAPGYIPGDQADHLTVELALKDFIGRTSERRSSGTSAGHAEARATAVDREALRGLLMHVYGRDLLPDSFEPFEPVPQPARVGVKHFLKSYGWGARAFTTASLRRFVRFLAERLGNM